MPAIRTARELGLAVRSRRKEMGLDQAELARRVGVTRQWVIDIEKGKPRAELELVMRALHALELALLVETPGQRQAGLERSVAVPNIDDVLSRFVKPQLDSSPSLVETFRRDVIASREAGSHKKKGP